MRAQPDPVPRPGERRGDPELDLRPATLDGAPVSVFYNLTVNFRLTKDKEEDKGDDHGSAPGEAGI